MNATRDKKRRREITVAVVQMNPRLGDVPANLEIYEQKLKEARDLGADLTVFPELSLTGYFLKDMVSRVALDLGSPEVGQLKKLSRRYGAFVCGLVLESADFRFFNAGLLLDRGKVVHFHRKVYLPTYGLFDEQRYLACGDTIRAFDSRFGRAAILVCEDLWHPSTVYLATLDGALMVIVPSASPIWGIEEGTETPENARYWKRLNRVYAESFGLFIIQANRVGFEDGVGFWGGSEVVGPDGEVLAKARYYEEEIVVAKLDLAAVRRRREVAPMLRDENVDLTINELLRIRGRHEGVRELEVAPGGAKAAAGRNRRISRGRAKK